MNNDGLLFDGYVVPTICVSTLSSDDRVETERRLGCYKCINKPFDKNTIDVQPSEGYGVQIRLCSLDG